ncbi:disease resistance protein Pik-2-like [Miscanthus floridulus]|uniref:disease resistance protein Pik-2-like n=1 Tax=Miscanthus floridulus TaxID=154761 RepID=UPI003457AB6B
MDLVVGASNNAVKSLVNKLGSLLAQEYTLIRGVRDDIQYITDELASMQAFLNKIKRVGDNDDQRLDWMKQVREVSYDIEDCVDDVDHRLSSEPRGSGALVYLRKKWYLLTTLYARHCIATEIGNLKARAQHVSERRTRYGVENTGNVENTGANDPQDRLVPPPQLFGTKEPVGLEDAMKELEPWFSNGSQQSTGNQLRFLAIFGSGGLGKTTLAMALYRKFGDDFGCRASVLASQKFNLRTVLGRLIKTFQEQQSGASMEEIEETDKLGEEDLKSKLDNLLKKKRYLILIDDVWSVSAWEKFRDSLPKNEKGSTIVVTTRFKSVSEACRRRNGRSYEHKPLLEKSSYNLFLESISGDANDDLCITTRPIISQIIMKCRGLPLAIIVVAGLMASKLKANQESNLDSLLEKFDKELSAVHAVLGNNLTTEGVTRILDQCYKDLPADLKTCLLYLSMFPKGCLISRKCLLRRWIAEGFIVEKDGKTVEEVAEHCFSELIDRNLVRPVNNSSNGKVKSC